MLALNIQWDAQTYQNRFSFVPQYGEDVLRLLTVPKGAAVVDLGCGNGALTEKLAAEGYRVVGIDASEQMLALARAEHPQLHFLAGDARTFRLPEQVDAVFSNAVFHWIDGRDQEKLIANIAGQLKPGGELVCEFGGRGCAESVHSALEDAFCRRGLNYPRTFYFPTIGEYAPLLERQGLRVEYAALFDRPTVQQSDDGLVDWINMFVRTPFEGVEPAAKAAILDEVRTELKGSLFVDGKWYIDYVRIRIRARKVP